MFTLGLVLFVIHIVAFIVGGANSVVMPIIGGRMATATPEGRAQLAGVAESLAKAGKYAMVTLLVTGVLVLWLKWDWVIPNNWFWAKMAFLVAMIVCIGLNEANAKKARSGDEAAARNARSLGMLTSLAFLGVVVSAVFAFN